MALSKFEHKRIERAVGKFMEKRRPPPHIRPKLDLGFRIKGQNVEIFSIRPRWNKPDELSEQSVAKATFTHNRAMDTDACQRRSAAWCAGHCER